MAGRRQRIEFLGLLRAIKNQMAKFPDFKGVEAICFTLEECKTDFLCGEEGIAYDTLVNNLYETDFPITDKIYKSLCKIGQKLGISPKKWPYPPGTDMKYVATLLGDNHHEGLTVYVDKNGIVCLENDDSTLCVYLSKEQAAGLTRFLGQFDCYKQDS